MPQSFLSDLLPFIPVLPPLAGAAAGIVAGMFLGAMHFGSLWWNTRLYATGGAGLALTIQVTRFALLFLVFAALAQMGAIALLAGAAGLLIVRRPIMRKIGRLA